MNVGVVIQNTKPRLRDPSSYLASSHLLKPALLLLLLLLRALTPVLSTGLSHPEANPPKPGTSSSGQPRRQSCRNAGAGMVCNRLA